MYPGDGMTSSYLSESPQSQSALVTKGCKSRNQNQNTNSCNEILRSTILAPSSSSRKHDPLHSMNSNTAQRGYGSSSKSSINLSTEEDKHLSHVSREIQMNMIDPLPFPPQNSHRHFKSNYQTEGACEIHTASKTTLPTKTIKQQDVLQQNQSLYLRSVVTAGIPPTAPNPQSLTREKLSESNSVKPWRPSTNGLLQPIVQASAVAVANSVLAKTTAVTKKVIPMSMKCDSDYISEFQCLIRQQIEIFES